MKKILILFIFSIYSFCLFDNLSTSVTFNSGYQKYNKEDMLFLSTGVNAQYKKDINEKFSVIVGPNISITYGNNLKKENKYVFSTNIGMNVKGKYEIVKEFGIYSKLEASIGGAIENDKDNQINYKAYPTVYGSIGGYYKNFNLGIYAGYGKGYVGVETEFEF